MSAVEWATVGAVVGTLASSLGVIWSILKSRSQKKATKQRELSEAQGKIDVKLSSGKSISINIGSATPEELVNFIDEVKEGTGDAEGNPGRVAES